MEIDKIEEEEPRTTIRAVSLPVILMVLKKAWKANQVNLEQAGVFNYLCWIQGVTRVAYVERVEQFISTYSMKSETARVNDRMIDFSAPVIRQFLKLPLEGLLLDQMPELTKEQHEEIFEGEFPRTSKGCLIEKARHHWRPWFKFVNNYLFFRPQKEMIAPKAIVAALNTWEGRPINSAKIVQQNIGAELVSKLAGRPTTVELFSAFYISELCQELPAPTFMVGGPSSSRQTPSPLSSPKKKEDDKAEIQRLTSRLRIVQTLANEKQDQLWEKSEALIKCQTENV